MQNGFSFKQRAVKMSDLLQTLLCRTAREWENGREIKIKLQVGEKKCMEQSDRQAHVPTRSTRVLHLWTFPLFTVWPFLSVLFLKYLQTKTKGEESSRLQEDMLVLPLLIQKLLIEQFRFTVKFKYMWTLKLKCASYWWDVEQLSNSWAASPLTQLIFPFRFYH